jgi:hypothetical protein
MLNKKIRKNCSVSRKHLNGTNKYSSAAVNENQKKFMRGNKN